MRLTFIEGSAHDIELPVQTEQPYNCSELNDKPPEVNLGYILLMLLLVGADQRKSAARHVRIANRWHGTYESQIGGTARTNSKSV